MTTFCIVFSESCLSTGRKKDAEYNRRLEIVREAES